MYSFSFDASALIKGLNLQLEVLAAQAVQSTAVTAQLAWQQTVLQTPGIWQPIRDRYAASIKVEYDANGMGARIYSDDPMATPIETGIPERDLKTMLNTSLKTRVATHGKYAGMRYLIIPFRHNTPGNSAHAAPMPAAVYAQVKDMAASRVVRQSFRPNELGVHGISGARTHQLLSVRSQVYDWGGRLKTRGLGLSRADSKRYRGMVRFDTSSGAQASSSYMTFRIMGEWSKGWKVPAQPGRYIVKGVAAAAQDMLKTELQAAIAAQAGS